MERLGGAQLYEAAADRVMALVDEADASAPVPACPGWTVSDVVAHVVGLADDVVAARVDGYATEAWTAAHVERRLGHTIAQMSDEWRALLPSFTTIIDDLEGSSLPDMVNTAIGAVPKGAFEFGYVVDLVNHEHDLRSALGRPRPPLAGHDGAVVRAMVTTARVTFAFAGLPAVVLRASDVDLEWAMGRDDPVAVCEAPLLDLLRSLAGRRTIAQMRGLSWSAPVGDDVLAALVVPFFSMPDDRVE